jgi:hypothetical protein
VPPEGTGGAPKCKLPTGPLVATVAYMASTVFVVDDDPSFCRAVVRLLRGFGYCTESYDSPVGFVNRWRPDEPGCVLLDPLLRRPFRLGAVRASTYVDARNLLNRRNVIAVHRETGTVNASETTIERLASAASRADSPPRGGDPSPIPYESARYRPEADLDHDQVISGRDELFPLYLAAVRDYLQPIFYLGPPRLLRLGIELLF